MAEVHDEIVARFKELHEAWLGSVKPQMDDFRESVLRFALKDRVYTNRYLDWVFDSMNTLRETSEHELTVKEYQTFIDDYVVPNSKCPPMEVERIKKMERTFVIAAKSHMGTAVGEILPPRRCEMYIALYDNNRETIIDMILKRSKKTVIFSTMVPVVKHIAEDLAKNNVKTVLIHGGVPNRLPLITQFKEDQQTVCLVATSQTLGVGLTLIEASQMFFFGTPWRSTDYEQACDRIWRIGQTDPVNIWNVMMQSRQKNLSTRMQDILNWSDRMFNAAITPTSLTGEPENPQAASESFVLESEDAIDTLYPYRHYKFLYDECMKYSYGYHVRGMLKSDAECDPSTEYTTITPEEFKRLKGGTCFDYCQYIYQELKKKGIKSEIYYIWFGEDESCHSFIVSPCNGRYVWIECAWKPKAGIYLVDSPEQVFQHIIDHSNFEHNDSYQRALVFKCRNINQLTHLTLGEYVESLTDKGVQVKFTPQKPDTRSVLENIALMQAVESSMADFEPQYAHRYYYITSETEKRHIDSVYDAYIQSNKMWIGSEPNGVIHIHHPGSPLPYNLWDRTLYAANQIIQDGLDGYMMVMDAPSWNDAPAWTHPVLIIPISEGCFILDVGNGSRAGLYFDVSFKNVPSHFYQGYQRDLEITNRKQGLQIRCAIMPLRKAYELSTTFEQVTDFLNRFWNSSKPFYVDFDPTIEPLHGVEVLRHGVRLERDL